MTMLMEAAVMKAQYGPEHREQQVEGDGDGAVGDLHRRARQQDDAHGEQDPQRHRPDVP
jgi:hypothetical protein